MPRTKEEKELHLQRISDLREYMTELFNKTEALCTYTFDNGIAKVTLSQLKMSEIYSLYNTVRISLGISDMYHHEYTSLLSFWSEVYSELFRVIEKSDKNTSDLYPKYTNYAGQHKIVDTMLKDQFEDLRKN